MSFLNQIISLLQTEDFVNKHEFIEIAKGKYKLHYDLKGTYKQAIREFKIQRANKWRKNEQ